MKDDETQGKGIVVILSNFGGEALVEPARLVLKVHKVRTGIPKRVAGIHYCYQDRAVRPFIAGIRLLMPRYESARFRSHFGDRDKIMFALQTFGIPTNHHPIQPDGTLSLECHREWLASRRMQEESGKVEQTVIVPRRFDVLFGRGRNTREHTGNLRAAHIVEMHRMEYERAGKMEKTAIAERIVGRFAQTMGQIVTVSAPLPL